MYETFFGLKKRPFSLVPDTESYFAVGSMEGCRKEIEKTLRSGEGLALVIGESGTGKTLLLRMIRQALEWEYTVSPITNGLIETPKAFYQQLLYNFHLPFSGTETTELRLQLLEFARQQITPGILLIFDESQYLNPTVLEEIRFLVSADDGAAPIFRAALAGTIEFEEKLTQPRLEAFNQRIVSRCYLEAFSCEETAQYIAWQVNSRCRAIDGGESTSENDETTPLSLADVLEQQGIEEAHRVDPPHRRQSLVFSSGAKRRIHNLTGGLPRLINQLCDKSLHFAAKDSVFLIDEARINFAWSLIQHIEPAGTVETILMCDSNEPVIPIENLEEIVTQKKETLQLRPFDSAIEFGTLDDADEPNSAADGEPELAETEIECYNIAECCEVPATVPMLTEPEITVYKPAYPDFDDVLDDEEKYEKEYDDNEQTEELKPILEVSVVAESETATTEKENQLDNLLLEQQPESIGTDDENEDDMDAKTLEEYGAAVLDGRPLFVRKEPNYAYQTTETAPEAANTIPYPDRTTGNIIELNWKQNDNLNGERFGTAYSQYQEIGGAASDTIGHQSSKVSVSSQPAGNSAVLKFSLNHGNQSIITKNSLDEIFDEVKTLKKNIVPLSELYGVEKNLARSVSHTGFDVSDQRIEEALQRITAAATKIEQAAEVSEQAGWRVSESAEYVEKEVKAALPTYVDMFRELSDFQKMLTAELESVGQTGLAKNKESKFQAFPFRQQIVIDRTIATIDVDSLFQ